MALDPLRPGDLDRLVKIMRATTIDDGFASVPAEPGEVGKRWMSKYDVSDRERLFAGQQGAEVTTRFQTYWDSLTSTLSANDTLLLDGVSYEISGVKELGRREGIELTTARRD